MEMTENESKNELWAKTMLEKIQDKTRNYSLREKQNARVPFLQNAIEKISAKNSLETEKWNEFQEKTTNVIALLPEKSEGEKLDYGNYLKNITNFKSYVQQKFNYVSKGFYLRIWIVIGIALGIPIGAVFGHISLGIPFGIGIGLIVGSYLDKKAAAENRVL